MRTRLLFERRKDFPASLVSCAMQRKRGDAGDITRAPWVQIQPAAHSVDSAQTATFFAFDQRSRLEQGNHSFAYCKVFNRYMKMIERRIVAT